MLPHFVLPGPKYKNAHYTLQLATEGGTSRQLATYPVKPCPFEHRPVLRREYGKALNA